MLDIQEGLKSGKFSKYTKYEQLQLEKEANRLNRNVKQIVIPIDDSIIKGAVKFKLTHSKRRFSFADAIGYVTARKYPNMQHEMLFKAQLHNQLL